MDGAHIIWSVYLTQLAAIIEATYFRYPQSTRWDFIAVAALVFVALGLAIRTWSLICYQCSIMVENVNFAQLGFCSYHCKEPIFLNE